MTTSHPYNPMQPGTGITYAILEITGVWHDSTCILDVTSRNYLYNQRIAHSPYKSPLLGHLPLYVGYQHPVSVPDEPVNLSASLIDGVCFADGHPYIGEAISQTNLMVKPFLAKLAFKPAAGQAINQTSKVYNGDGNQISTLRWKYRTIDHYPAWGAFADCWRTGLREYHSEISPTVADAVYNYVYMKDVGLVDLWYGQFEPNGSVHGYEYYALLT